MSSQSTKINNSGNTPLPAKQDPKKLIRASYECTKKIMELDTLSTITDLNLLESLNNSATLKYKELDTYLDGMVSDSEKLVEINKALKLKESDLGLLEKRVSSLLLLSNQLNEWSSELEVKSRRYGHNGRRH